MISIVGIGNGASAIAAKFEEYAQYNVYKLNDKVEKNSGKNRKLKRFESPEEYEQNIPNLSKFFAKIDERVQVFVIGSSYSSNYSLGILEQIKDKKIDLFYIKPDTELLTGTPKLMENTTFGVLQEYARSGVIDSMTIMCNKNIEEALGNVPIKKFHDSLNTAVASTLHYLNYFDHNEPEVGVMSTPAPTSRIRSIGMIDPVRLKEKWFFDLDMEREVCYYLCINKEKLETDGSLHRKIVDILKEKPRNAFRKISYAIYETPSGRDFGFCMAYTNAVQSVKKDS